VPLGHVWEMWLQVSVLLLLLPKRLLLESSVEAASPTIMSGPFSPEVRLDTRRLL